jgi:hypothetical protein
VPMNHPDHAGLGGAGKVKVRLNVDTMREDSREDLPVAGSLAMAGVFRSKEVSCFN